MQRRGLPSHGAIVLALSLAALGAAGGCGLLVGIEKFEAAPIDATVVDTSAVDDGGSNVPPPDGCAGFMCGSQCVLFGDPTFGCGPERGCAPCPVTPHTEAGCVDTACTTACNAPFVDCNGLPADGCEADLTGDRANCGACDAGCGDPQKPDCVDSACVIHCTPPTRYCQGNCIDMRTSMTHCGACGNTCQAVPFGAIGKTECMDGGCVVRCPTGYGDCNGVPGDGCETNVRTSNVQHCGSCAACPATAANATAITCATDRCKATCQSGFADCDGVAANGCECNLATNNCNNNQCVGPCKAAGTSCSGDSECCGATAGTGFCSTDSDGNYVSCSTK